MGNKKVNRGRVVKSRNVGYEHYLFPSLIGGFIAWFFADTITLGIVVFMAVLVGNYIGFRILTKR